MDDRHRRVQHTLWDVQKRWGQQALGVFSRATQSTDVLASGFPALDTLLGGGLARGQIALLTGTPTSGQTTLAYKLLANAQGEASSVVCIDTAGDADPDYARRCGVALDRLLLVRPADAAEALRIARDLLREGQPAVIMVDLLLTGADRVLTEALPLLHESVTRTRTVLLVLNRSPLTGHFLHTHLHIERLTWLHRGADVVGYRVRITLTRDKAGNMGKRVEIDITFDDVVTGDGA